MWTSFCPDQSVASVFGRSASNIPTSRSTEYHQLRPEMEMVWTGCSTLLHNKYCNNSVIDSI